jgi:hypothetical protein
MESITRAAAGGASAGPQPRVAFIGGVERIEREILCCGHELGIEVEVHNGHTRGGGGGIARLTALIHRNDLVIIITGTNSHAAVRTAKREAVKSGARVRIVKFCGAGTARSLLAEVARSAAA